MKAVDGISFTINAGETLGLVGSPARTTTSKLILAAEEPTAGAIEFEGRNIVDLGDKDLMEVPAQGPGGVSGPLQLAQPPHAYRRDHQSIQTHERISGRITHGSESFWSWLVSEPIWPGFSHEFSGERQVGHRPSPVTNARLIVLDEPVSALDVSIRAHISSWRRSRRGWV